MRGKFNIGGVKHSAAPSGGALVLLFGDVCSVCLKGAFDFNVFVFYKLIFIAFMFIKIEFHVYIIFFANNFKEKQKRTTLKQVKYTLRSRGQSALASGQLG